MFNKYYQSELSYLRSMGREFAQTHPALAGLLAARGNDPDVERLLEAFAFLTARIRERAEDCVPEIAQMLAELSLPHFVRSLPSASIVEFIPRPGALRAKHCIARHTPLASIPVQGTVCHFRTIADIHLIPARITQVTLDERSAIVPRLYLELAGEPGLTSLLSDGGLRLFIAGDYASASQLLLWFLRHCSRVSVQGTDANGHASTVALANRAIRHALVETSANATTSESCALVPWPSFAPQGYRWLQEYFHLPSKFLFFDVTGFEDAQCITSGRIRIVFEFERPPALGSPVDLYTLRLNCTPVVNVFRASAEPIRRELIDKEHLLRAADIEPAHMEIYSVETVTGARKGTSERVVYSSFVSFSHAGARMRTGLDSASGDHVVRRALSPLDGAVDTYLSMGSAKDHPMSSCDETLSIDVLCTNRRLTQELNIGDIQRSTYGSPTVASFRNITEITRPTPPPLGKELYWRLLSHLNLNHRSLCDAEVLRALMCLYNFQDASDHRSGSANQLRADAVDQVHGHSMRTWWHGAALRGVHARVHVDESKFASRGDAFIFGSIINELFAAHVALNAFSQLTLILQPTRGEYSWPARAGHKSLL